jgi:site-specific DNA recombinase
MSRIKSDILIDRQEAVVYARVSSKEQEKEGFSIPAQLRLLHEYASQSRLIVSKEFVDVETAKQSGRTGFTDMLAYLKANTAIKTILVEKTDRLYRNIRDWVTLDELGLEIHFAKEGVILSRESRSSEKFMHGIKVLMAKNYIDNLSEETRKGMTEKAEQGIWPSNAPLGYLNVKDKDGKKTIVPDPETAPLIVKAFEWYATGNYSVKEIAAMLKDVGLTFKKSKSSVPQSSIHKILRSRIYTGEFEWGGKIYKGKYEPVITSELLGAVQDIFDNRASGRRKKRKHDFAFSGLIQCGYTGGSLVGDLKKGKYVYYRAIGAKGIPYVKEEELERQFGEALKKLSFDEDVLEWVCQALKESHVDKRQYHEETLSRLQGEYKRLESRIDGMYVDKLDGKISEIFFEEKAKAWREEQKTILAKIQSLHNADQTYIEEGVQLLELAQNAGFLFMKQSAHEKRRLLNFLLSNCIWKDGLLTVQFKQPFDMLSEFISDLGNENAQESENNAVFEKWLLEQDSNLRPID